MKSLSALLLCLCAVPNILLAEPDAERADAVRAVNTFGVALHRLQSPGNALTSPWSIQTNMAMVYAGAAGKTRDEMRKAFFYPENEAALHTGFQSLRTSVLAKPAAADAGLEIRVANQVFHAPRVELLPGWLTTARSFYASGARAMDFERDLAGSQRSIDQWVSDQTHQKIPAIIPAGALKPDTLVVLVNAVYFDQPWEERFTKELTQDQPFHVDATRVKTVPLMFKQHRLAYARKDGFQIAALPYAGGAFQFVVFLPDAVDGLAKVESALTGELLAECTRLTPTEVRLSFPRIRLEPPIVDLKTALKQMGSRTMFDIESADLSRMMKNGDRARVSNVFHRAFMELDEDGTKAAAATATIIRPKNGVPHEVPHQVVKADHPFLFMIQHVPTGACLFLGRLTDPAPEVKAVNATATPERPAKK